MLNFDYPKIVFLDGISHQGNTLKDRVVCLHIPTMTMIEFLHLESYEYLHINEEYVRANFVYEGVVGEEHITAVVYKTQSDNIKEVVQEVVAWYKDYLNWEDKNIIEDGI